MLIVQDRVTSTADSTATPMPTIAVGARADATGGSLAVSGDREGAFTLDRDSYDVADQSGLRARLCPRRVRAVSASLGEDGAIYLGTIPRVEQIDFEAMAFYPEPDACTITPGELNPAIGVASARPAVLRPRPTSGTPGP